MSELDKLALAYGTDKASTGHNYCTVYDRYFAPYRSNSFTVVELGVWEGASLLMWADYFPNALIIGVDISLDRVRHDVRGHSRIQLLEHDCSSPFDLDGVAICIDDASHLEEQQTATLKWLKPRATHFYAIEDCHTHFWPHANEHGAWDRIVGTELKEITGQGHERALYDWCAHVHPSLVVFERVVNGAD